MPPDMKHIEEIQQKVSDPNISSETIDEIRRKAAAHRASPDKERIHAFFSRLTKGKNLSKEEVAENIRREHGMDKENSELSAPKKRSSDMDENLPEFYRDLRKEIESDAQFAHRYEIVFLENEDDYISEYLPYEYDVKADIHKIGHDPNSFGLTDEDPALAHWLDQVSAPIKDTLACKDKRYKRIMRAFSVTDYRDNPAYVASSGNCWVWLEEGATQDKILVQLGNHVPPMMWVPLRATKDAMKRLFDEVTAMEAGGAGKIIEATDEMLTKINFDAEDVESKTKQDDFFKYINNADPKSHQDLYPNSLTMFLGNTDDIRTSEQSFMNNPYVFNTPVILGSSNKHTRGTPVVVSKFRTIMTRSIVTIVARYDFQLQLAGMDEDSTWNVPIFATINYPDNKLVSRPIPQRINRLFNTCFPENTPLDVIGALIPFKMRTWESVREYISGMKADEVPPQMIAHLAVLGDPNFEEIFETYQNDKDPVYRLACVMGAAHLGKRDLVEKMIASEQKSEVREIMSRVPISTEASS